MRVQTEEWRKFIPGVRMYKGKKTLFLNGEKLWSEGQPLVYDRKERNSWEVIIILPGVEIIPEGTFYYCKNVEIVIMADAVKRIEKWAFSNCYSLKFVKLSRNLEFIGISAFQLCKSLTSIFMPPSCREIAETAFLWCKKLIILGLPQHIQLGESVFQKTKLMKNSPLEIDEYGCYNYGNEEEAVQWLKSINNGETQALHRACASYNPLSETIHDLVMRQGIKAMRIPNAIGVTPSQYLAANPFAEISEKEIINRYILDSMGEIVLPR
ncbi:hypothetical protein CTEN210_03521 [Chaetoceros tenuissimus]|uniref:Leucine-rich repeat domain-containing protein n=1 Tax=Chaetoceros tenuissimus TaxID=426638 RepID=A0AAD3CLF6_9STRA|nr:hypothetical protein CTEN210_03521 [Chaetoceros tenuissimus]